MRLRRSLRLGLAVAVLLAVAVVAVPLYRTRVDAQAQRDVQAAAKAIVLPGSARACAGPDGGASRCSHTTGPARAAITAPARQLRGRGFEGVETTCSAKVTKLPELCIVIAVQGDHLVSVAATPHLMPDPPLRVSGLDVAVRVD